MVSANCLFHSLCDTVPQEMRHSTALPHFYHVFKQTMHKCNKFDHKNVDITK